MKKKKILCIIPARGGSKSIPRKNIKLFCGRPLISYIINCAKEADIFERIIVSTDDDEIAGISRKYGAEAPFLRPAALAQDTTQSLPVVKHVIERLESNEHYLPDLIMVLQATSPLVQPFHLRQAVDSLLRNKADSAVSVARIPENYNPCNAMVLNGKFLKLFNGQPVGERIPRRQDRPATFWSVGAFYLFKTNLILDSCKPTFYGKYVLPVFIENKYVADINEPENWAEAEKKFAILLK